MHDLLYFYFLMVDMDPDPLHGCHRDFDMLTKAMRVKSLWMALAILWNLDYGLDRDHQRNHPTSCHLVALYGSTRLTALPLYQSKRNEIEDCFKKNKLI